MLDEDPLSHERLDEITGRGWEDAGGRFTVGTALEVDALEEAGIEQADVFIASTDGDNTNLTVAQIAQRRYGVSKVICRVMDPARAAWYAEQGLHTISPTQHAIEMFARALDAGGLGPGMYVIVAGPGKVGLEPRARADRQGPRGHAAGGQPAPLPRRRGGARARRPVRRRDRAVGARAGRHLARRPRHRRHRRRRGQHARLPGGQGEVPLRAGDRPRQQPAQPPALQAPRHPAGRLGDRPDPPPDRARGAALRPRPPARPRGGAARDHRARGPARRAGRRPPRRRRRACPRAAW